MALRSVICTGFTLRLAGIVSMLIGGILLSGCGGSSRETLTLTGSSTVAPLAADIALRFEARNPDVRIDVQSGGSSRGIADALSGLADIGMASRSLKPEDGDLVLHRVAMDGVAVILHGSNTVEGLTREQLIAIYTGKTPNWNALGGGEGEIVVVNKSEGHATQEVFLKFLGLDSADVASDLIVGENQQAIKTVAGNAQAIGYVSIGAGSQEADMGTPIRLIPVDAVEPAPETVADGSFPIARPLLFLTHGELTPLQTEFIEFAQSPEVHDLIEKHLYVPIQP